MPRAPLALALPLALLAAGPARAFQEVRVDTIEGNPPTGNEPWEICYGEYAQTAIDTAVDFDTFRFLADAGDVVRISVHTPHGLDPVLQLLDPSGMQIDSVSCGGSCSIVHDTAPLPAKGIYTLLVSDGGLNEGGSYTLSLERLLPATWIPWLPYNQTQSFGIDYATDIDWRQFVADAGSTVALAVNTPHGLDPVVSVFDPSGAFLDSANCGGSCSLLLTLPSLAASGVYTVLFRDNGANEGGTLNVTLNCIFHPTGSCPDHPVDVPLGTNYCSTAPNSTGAPAVMTALGSASVLDDRLFLTATDVPIGQFGLFFFGRNQISVPLAPPSQGTLCVSGGLVRAPLLMACNDRTLRLRLELHALPHGQVFLPGERWNFQAWFRDQNPGATSNTTDGLSILFQ